MDNKKTLTLLMVVNKQNTPLVHTLLPVRGQRPKFVHHLRIGGRSCPRDWGLLYKGEGLAGARRPVLLPWVRPCRQLSIVVNEIDTSSTRPVPPNNGDEHANDRAEYVKM